MLTQHVVQRYDRYDRAAVRHLLDDEGIFYVRLADNGQPLAGIPWSHYPAPDLYDVMAHIEDGHPLGFVPGSLDLTGVDVDQGDPQALAALGRPVVAVPTKRPGRAHILYPRATPAKQKNRLFLSSERGLLTQVDEVAPRRRWKVDVRDPIGGYLQLHGNAPTLLAEALSQPDEAVPLDKIVDGPLHRRLFGPSPARGESGPPPVDGGDGRGFEDGDAPDVLDAWRFVPNTGEGGRNDAMREHLFRWLASPKRRAARGDADAIRVAAVEINARRFDPPLPPREVLSIVKGVAAATAYPTRFPDITEVHRELLREKGRAGASARNAHLQERNGAVVSLRLRGATYSEIAALDGRSRRQLTRIAGHANPKGARDAAIVEASSSGLTNAAVAERFGVSADTVKRAKRQARHAAKKAGGVQNEP